MSTLPVAAAAATEARASKSNAGGDTGATGEDFAGLLGLVVGTTPAASVQAKDGHGSPEDGKHPAHGETEAQGAAAGTGLGATALLLSAAGSLAANAAAAAGPAQTSAQTSAHSTVPVTAAATGTQRVLGPHGDPHAGPTLPATAVPAAAASGRPTATATGLAPTADPAGQAHPPTDAEPTGTALRPGQLAAAAAHADPATVQDVAGSLRGERAGHDRAGVSSAPATPTAGGPPTAVPAAAPPLRAADPAHSAARADAPASSGTSADTGALAQAVGPTATHTMQQPAVQPQAAPAAGSATLPVPQPELAQALASLRSRPNGTHELSVQLHPAELGAVQVTATISNGQLTVTLACAHQAARDAVAAALPALQQQLQGANFGGVDLGFGAFAQQQGGQSAPQPQPGAAAAHSERVPAEPAPTVAAGAPRRVLSDSGLDRLL